MPTSLNPSDDVRINDDKGVVEEEEEEEEEQNNSSSTTKSSNDDGDDDDDDEIRTERLTQQNTALKAEINHLKAENEALKLESTTRQNNAATLLKMENNVVVMDKSNSSTQNTNSSSYVSFKDSNDGSDDKNAVLEFEGEIEFDFAFVLLPCGEDDDDKPFLLPKRDEDHWLSYLRK
jgi:hypothetical protein